MKRFAHHLLVFCTCLAAFAAAVMDGRVLCISGSHHIALEAPHEPDCCPAAHQEHDSSDDHAPDDCSDFSIDVNLTRDTGSGPLDLQHVQYFLPPLFSEAVAFAGLTEPTFRRFAPHAHPPAPGDLARLGGIILLI